MWMIIIYKLRSVPGWFNPLFIHLCLLCVNLWWYRAEVPLKSARITCERSETQSESNISPLYFLGFRRIAHTITVLKINMSRTHGLALRPTGMGQPMSFPWNALFLQNKAAPSASVLGSGWHPDCSRDSQGDSLTIEIIDSYCPRNVHWQF